MQEMSIREISSFMCKIDKQKDFVEFGIKIWVWTGIRVRIDIWFNNKIAIIRIKASELGLDYTAMRPNASSIILLCINQIILLCLTPEDFSR